MNLSEYWQENKRFATTVIVGVLVFFIAFLMLDSSLGKKDKAIRKRISEAQQDLRGDWFDAADRSDAESDNERLAAITARLSSEIAFQPRPEFVWTPEAGSRNNLYLKRVDEIREDLRQLASRSRANLPDGLGLEKMMTTDAATIERQLVALDVLDRCVRQALQAGVDSIDRIRVKLDPGFQSRDGVGPIERTQVIFEMAGNPKAIQAFIVATQSDEYGAPMIIDEYEGRNDKRLVDRVGLNLTCTALTLHVQNETEELD